MKLEQAIKNLKQIIELSRDEIDKKNEKLTAILDLTDLESLDIILAMLEGKYKTIGIIRHTDDLGRIVIPNDIRKMLKIKEGTPLEVFADIDGTIVLKKHFPIEDEFEITIAKQQYEELIDEYEKLNQKNIKLQKENIELKSDNYELNNRINDLLN